MILPRMIAALLLAALAACAAVVPEPAGPGWYAMRHLQKADGPDPGLSGEGRAGAERLAGWFGDEPPAAVYVSTTRRARETAAPLAARLGLTPKEYDPSDTPGLIARVRAEAGPVLIVGHSNTVPEIVERLGGTRPADLGEGDYGDVWLVWRDGRTERRRVGD
jgi:broad specificity phosphatase PhoE